MAYTDTNTSINAQKNITELRIRLDKTRKGGDAIKGKFCNLSCLACHDDNISYSDPDALAITNSQYAKGVSRIMDATNVEKAILYLAGRGEPTYVGSDELCDLISLLKKIPHVKKVKMTTNGLLLKKMITSLKDAGLDGVNISINSLNAERYSLYTGVDGLPQVLKGLDLASHLQIGVTVNVIFSKLNYDEVESYVRLSQEYDGIVVKFFKTLPANIFGERMFAPMDRLNEKLMSISENIEYEEGFYSTRTYTFPKGGKIIVKGSTENNCLNLQCPVRDKCDEDCRNVVRIGLDGVLRPCGVRLDNVISLVEDSADKQVIECLSSGGKYF